MRARIEQKFKLKENNTNIKIEMVAGVSTFMTMAYILILQPMFMRDAGMDYGAVLVATALLSGVFTLVMGLYTNLPFALAPAMGTNAFFAYTLVANGTVSWQTGLGVVFLSGMFFVILTVLGLREVIVKMIPKNLKVAIGAAIGFFIAQLGFKNGGLMTIGEGSISMGDFTQPTAILAIIGLVVVVALTAHKVRGALLWGILVTTLIGIPMGITTVPESLVSLPPSIEPIAFKLDIIGALKWSFIPVLFTFFVGDFFSTLGTLLGVSAKAGLLDEEGNLPNIEKPFLVDATATVVGALCGSTTVTTFIESAAGVEEGGRTGLTAVSTAMCFFAALFITPVFAMIPSAATAPALIMIGIMMLEGLQGLDYKDFTELFPCLAMILFTAYTASIAVGISIGIVAYVAVKVLAGKAKDIHIGLYFLCIPLIMYFIM